MIRIDYSKEPRRHVLCIDVRSFFASIEARERGLDPRTALLVVMSKPNQEGGLVLAASTRVKELYGIRTGTRRFEIPSHLPIDIVEPRMQLYLTKNIEITHIFRRFVSEEDLHLYSIDESFLDVTRSIKLFGEPAVIAHRIQQAIWKEIGVVVTIGIGDNPLLAKLALDNEAKNRPETHYIADWRYETVENTIWKIKDLTNMWGIGNRTARNLQLLGIRSVYELAQFDVNRLKKLYGIIGEQLFFHAHGIDQSIISEKYIPLSRSYSKNQILDRDYTIQSEVEVVLREMTDQVASRLREHHVESCLIHLSIGYSKDIFEDGFSRQMSIHPTSSSKKMIEYVLRLFRIHNNGQPVRQIGIQCGKIHYQTDLQLDLFEEAEKTIRQMELDRIIDQIRMKYGYASLVHASSLSRGATAIKRSGLIGGHQG